MAVVQAAQHHHSGGATRNNRTRRLLGPRLGRFVALEITPAIVIPDDELEWKFIRASGPGGQNVNKVSSAVQLRFILPRNSTLPVSVRNRLRSIAGQRLNEDGTILFSARS